MMMDDFSLGRLKDDSFTIVDGVQRAAEVGHVMGQCNQNVVNSTIRNITT